MVQEKPSSAKPNGLCHETHRLSNHHPSFDPERSQQMIPTPAKRRHHPQQQQQQQQLGSNCNGAGSHNNNNLKHLEDENSHTDGPKRLERVMLATIEGAKVANATNDRYDDRKHRANTTAATSSDEEDEPMMSDVPSCDDMMQPANGIVFNGFHMVADRRRLLGGCNAAATNGVGLARAMAVEDMDLRHEQQQRELAMVELGDLQRHHVDELATDDEEEEEEEDDFDYLRLDTIVEEDEQSDCASEDLRQDHGDSDQREWNKSPKHLKLAAIGKQQASDKVEQQQADSGEPCGKVSQQQPMQVQPVSTQSTQAPLASAAGPLAESSGSPASNSMRKFTTNASQLAATMLPQSPTNNINDPTTTGANNGTNINNNHEDNGTAGGSSSSSGNNSSNQAKCDKATTIANNTTTNISAAHQQQQQQQQAKAKMQQQCNQQLPLPSTNRLISEHQVRQQQALFRCLAERQKMMDELGAGQRVDLMSAASLNSSLMVAASRRAKRADARSKRRRSRSVSSSRAAGSATGVPLSAVDLSSMSDRMLDELLGHIASASSSSSSLSSNGESLGSSDLTTTDDDGASDVSTGDESGPSGLIAAHALANEPNVIGVHEDERTRCGSQTSGRQLNCRDTHRGSLDTGRPADDDDDDDHELVVNVAPDGNPGDLSVSPTEIGGHPSAAAAPKLSRSTGQTGAAAAAGGAGSNPLELYFTSNLVNPRDFSAGDAASEAPADAARDGGGHSVEEVLARMLEALNEIGTDDQEQLNELLERGFAHLEQLLNCSLAPGSGQQQQQPTLGQAASVAIVPAQHRSQPNLAQKLISNGNNTTNSIHRSQQQQVSGSSSTMLSKDSDYGSDTQSADCFSQFNDHTSTDSSSAANQQQARFAAGRVNSAEFSHSPSPTSLTTNGSSSTTGTPASAGNPPGAASANSATAALSPLAIELSFRLAESLHRLAQQQAAQRRPQQQQQHLLPQQPQPTEAPSDQPASSPDETRMRKLVSPTSPIELEGSTPPIRRSPMKSIVMINATRSPSAASVLSSASSCSGASLQQAAVGEPVGLSAHTRNMTPTATGGQQQQAQTNRSDNSSRPVSQDDKPTLVAQQPTTRQPFKTRVNIGTRQQQVSNCMIVAPEPPTGAAVAVAENRGQHRKPVATVAAQSSLASSVPHQDLHQESSPDSRFAPLASEPTKLEQKSSRELSTGARVDSSDSVKLSECESSSASQVEVESKSQVVKVSASSGQSQQVVVPSPSVVQAFERRRSSRSSLRRRPSFSGSICSQGSREARPGSPVPLMSTVHRAELGSGLMHPQQAPVSGLASGSLAAAAVDKEAELKQKQKQLQRALVLAQKYNYSPAKLAASKLSSKLHLKELASEHHQQAGFAIYGSQTLNGHRTNDNNKDPASMALGGWTLDRHQLQANADNRRRQQQQQQQQHRQPINITGQVQLDITYFAKSGSLTVHVMQCSQLAPVSKRRTTSNPYVKLYLLPDRSKGGKRKSTIHRNQLDPKFDEKFTFGPLQLAEFDNKILWLSVWHKDRLGRNEFLGQLLLPMSQIRQQLLTSDLCQSTSARWYQLCDRFEAASSGGKHPEPNHHQTMTLGPATTTTTAARQPANRLPAATGGQPTDSDASGTQPTAPSIQQSNTLEKLGELQRKAARLATTAASPAGRLPSPIMNVSLGPLAELGPNRTPITGQLFVALKFVADERHSGLPAGSRGSLEGELQVMIKEARNIGGFDLGPLSLQATLSNNGDSTAGAIQRPPAGSLPNPFCKCYLLASNGHRLAKQKTPHLKRTVNPRWDHKCQFGSIRLASLASQAIEIHMFNRDSILVSNNEYLGGVRLCRATSSASASTTTSSLSSASYATVVPASGAAANEPGADSTSIASDQSNSDMGSQRVFSKQDSSGSGASQSTGLTLRHPKQTVSDELDDGALCSERESRLWNQMLARPGIWVYGELRLRQLRPLVAASKASRSTNGTASNGASSVAPTTK